MGSEALLRLANRKFLHFVGLGTKFEIVQCLRGRERLSKLRKITSFLHNENVGNLFVYFFRRESWKFIWDVGIYFCCIKFTCFQCQYLFFSKCRVRDEK